MRKRYFKQLVISTALVLSGTILSKNTATAQINLWGHNSSIGVSAGEFAYDFINTGTPGNYNDTTWTALSVYESGGNVVPGDAYWTRNMLGYSQGAYWTNTTPVTSVSQSNGVAIFDSDFMDNNGVVGAFGTGSSPSPHRGDLISPLIDLTGYTNQDLAVSFFVFYRNYDIYDLSVSFSSDNGATWGDPVDYRSTVPDFTETWTTVSLPAASTAGIADLTQCRIKFTFDGDYYFVIVDDVTVIHPENTCITTFSNVTTSSCENFLSPSGNYTWNSSGTYNDTIVNANGCDSVMTINLTINQPSTSTLIEAGCGSYTWNQNGMTYNSTGLYYDTISTVFGCDSIVTLDLTINNLPVATASDNGNGTLTASAGAAYEWYDCTNMQLISGATSQTYTVTANGDYAVLVTNAAGCTDTSNCITINNIGLLENDQFAFDIFPNPAQDYITILAEACSKQLELTDANGKVLKTVSFNGEIAIDVSGYTKGLYFIRISGNDSSGTRSFIKQ